MHKLPLSSPTSHWSRRTKLFVTMVTLSSNHVLLQSNSTIRGREPMHRCLHSKKLGQKRGHEKPFSKNQTPIDFIWWCKVTLQLAKKGRGETNLCNYSKEQQKDYTAHRHCCFHSRCVCLLIRRDEGLNDDLTAFIKWMMWTTWMGWMTFIWYVNNIHRARVNIGWYLASAIWPEVRTVDRVYIFAEPQARQILTRSTVRTEGHITS